VGVQLGILLTVGFGAGVLFGGLLADRVGRRAGRRGKLGVCVAASVGILPVAFLMSAASFGVVLTSVPLYFALSGVVTACGFSAILDAVPNRSRGLAMALAFFLNVAIGAAAGPSAVTCASARLFGGDAGLAPALTLTVAGCFAFALLSLLFAGWRSPARKP
jgi:MFS family permease